MGIDRSYRSACGSMCRVSLDLGSRGRADDSDLVVKIVHVDATDRVSILSDSTKPVRSASWDPTGTYLVTASCDGKLRIYDMSPTTPVLLKIMDGVIAPSEPE